MKITCLGTGTMGSVTRGNQSILVDDILFDIGSGVVKKIESMHIYTKRVNYLIITHAHADHFVDLPNFLIGRNIRKENDNLLKIICGKGIREKVIQLFELCFADGKTDKYKNIEEYFNIKFIELDNNEVYEEENLKITAYELDHGTCKPILGYILEKDDRKLGYATDTTICENVKTICENSDLAFLDATNIDTTTMHMGVETVQELANQYPNTKVLAIHRSDYTHNQITTVEFPEDGEIINL